MAKDYKHRTHSRDARTRNRNRRSQSPGGIGVFKWMLITALIIGFAVFLVYLKSPGFQKQALLAQNQEAVQKPNSVSKNQDDNTEAHQKSEPAKPAAPQFDFYTILPKKEIVLPEHEIKTRTREEQVGKNKKANYVIKAGSYRNLNEADALKAKLALMGIESKIQKAKVESASWYTVMLGPYAQMSSVTDIISRLQKNGLKPVTAEQK